MLFDTNVLKDIYNKAVKAPIKIVLCTAMPPNWENMWMNDCYQNY